MSKKDKIMIGLGSAAGILLIFSMSFFCAAIFCTPKQDIKQNHTVRVYINEDDSLIYKLQQDVERLSTIIDKLSADTLVLELRRPTIGE